ncbi:MAG: hypothetical protein GXO92_00135 [FCB group bacterium]|nr:hypothetical protein [FCB group bacterium]
MFTDFARKILRWLPVLFLPAVVLSQIDYTGKFNPYGLFRISDGTEISLPFRLLQVELNTSRGNWDFKTNLALEYRWSNREYDFDVREAYLVWYPRFGEVTIGKQIYAWGAADGNNPTDNLNAYDYYYLFLPGTDRKIGSLSASATVYFDSWKIEGVVIPEHQKDRMPFNEPDFPIAPPFQPTEEQMVKVGNPLEYGLRIQRTIGEADFSLSYFRGHDRGFSLLGYDLIDPTPQDSTVFPGFIMNNHFGYRATQVLGADMVTYRGDLGFRAEAAYFKTSNNYDESWTAKFEAEAEYVQYVLQLEYTTPLDIQVNAQFIGNTVLKAKGRTLDFTNFQPVALTTENFIPGMGTPFAMFADRAVMVTASADYFDGRLELRATEFINLDETGSMFGLGTTYSPRENWNIRLDLIKLNGDENDPGNAFTRLEDFSHVNIGLEYNF